MGRLQLSATRGAAAALFDGPRGRSRTVVGRCFVAPQEHMHRQEHSRLFNSPGVDETGLPIFARIRGLRTTLFTLGSTRMFLQPRFTRGTRYPESLSHDRRMLIVRSLLLHPIAFSNS